MKKKVEKVEITEAGEVIERVTTFRVLCAFVLESGKRYEPQTGNIKKLKVYELSDLSEVEKDALLEMEAISIAPAEVPELVDEEIL